jgi:AraC-like DNA-binding protein
MQTRVAISVVRCFAAPDWTPTDCGVAMGVEPGPIAREQLGGAKLHRAPDYSWVRLPRSILARPPETRWPVETSAGTGEEPMQDLVGSLGQALRPYLAAGAPSLREAADLAGTSVRSLQRELARAGSSYRDVLQRAKLDTARELLEQPEVRILEVAFETGFSDPAHFTHFFRRLAGVTPRQYRTTLLEGRAAGA